VKHAVRITVNPVPPTADQVAARKRDLYLFGEWLVKAVATYKSTTSTRRPTR